MSIAYVSNPWASSFYSTESLESANVISQVMIQRQQYGYPERSSRSIKHRGAPLKAGERLRFFQSPGISTNGDRRRTSALKNFQVSAVPTQGRLPKERRCIAFKYLDSRNNHIDEEKRREKS